MGDRWETIVHKIFNIQYNCYEDKTAPRHGEDIAKNTETSIISNTSGNKYKQLTRDMILDSYDVQVVLHSWTVE